MEPSDSRDEAALHSLCPTCHRALPLFFKSSTPPRIFDKFRNACERQVRKLGLTPSQLVKAGSSTSENAPAKEDQDYQILQLHKSLSKLIESTRAGCHFCSLLEARIQTLPEPSSDSDYGSDNEDVEKDRRFQPDDAVYLHLNHVGRHEDDKGIEVHVSYMTEHLEQHGLHKSRHHYSYIPIWIGKWNSCAASLH